MNQPNNPPFQSFNHRRIIIALLLTILAFGFCYNLGEISLRAEEPRRAAISMEMIFSGDYIHPTLNNWNYFNKPPLFNWVQIVFMKAFDSNAEWVARIPSLLSHLLIGILMFFGFKPFIGKNAATYSALLYIVAAELIFYGTIFSGEIDLFFSLLVFLQIISLFIFYQRKQYLYLFLASYLFAALGTLTKGPPSIAFQGLTIIAMAVLYKDLRLLFRWQHFVGGALFLVICGGYFFAYNSDGDAIAYMVRLFKEASQRTGMETAISKTILGIINVPFQILILIIPSSLLIPFLFKKGNYDLIKSNPLLSFSLFFVLFNLPLYWFTGDFKNRYVYMFFPFIILFFAYFYEKRKDEMPKLMAIFEKIISVILFILPIAFIAFIFTPVSNLVENAAIVGTSLAIGFLGISYFYARLTSHRLLLLILAIAFLRVGVNFIYPPFLDDHSETNIKSEMNIVLEIAKERSVQFVGLSRLLVSDASIGPFKFSEVTTEIPAHMSYEIPYYYALKKNEPFEFTTEIVPGRLYLAYEWFLRDKEYTLLHEFIDTDNQKVLFIEG